MITYLYEIQNFICSHWYIIFFCIFEVNTCTMIWVWLRSSKQIPSYDITIILSCMMNSLSCLEYLGIYSKCLWMTWAIGFIIQIPNTLSILSWNAKDCHLHYHFLYSYVLFECQGLPCHSHKYLRHNSSSNSFCIFHQTTFIFMQYEIMVPNGKALV